MSRSDGYGGIVTTPNVAALRDAIGNSLNTFSNGVNVTSGTLTAAGGLVSSGVLTASGGLAESGARTTYFTYQVRAAADGTNSTPVATELDVAQIRIDANCDIVTLANFNGGTDGTDKWIYAIFDEDGTFLRSTATAGVTVSGTDSWQEIDLTATLSVTSGVYWLGLYCNGTTARYNTITALSEGYGLAGTITSQTFGTVVNITVPTDFTADQGPIMRTKG